MERSLVVLWIFLNEGRAQDRFFGGLLDGDGVTPRGWYKVDLDGFLHHESRGVLPDCRWVGPLPSNPDDLFDFQHQIASAVNSRRILSVNVFRKKVN